jgi:hypothetical protein
MTTIKVLTPIIAIAAISGLEYCALSHGIDGTMFIIIIAVISGIAGYNVPGLITQVKTNIAAKKIDKK